jgi:tetratricopeptide (TPR) repeat protein
MSFMRLVVRGLAFALAFALHAPAMAQGGPLQQAQALLQKGEFDAASKQVDAYLAGQPKDARGRFMKGLILSGQHRTDEAIKVFSELTYDFPELPEPYNNLGVLYAARGEYEKARDALQRALQARPNFATALENLGDIYAQLASQSYERALQSDRNNQAVQKKLSLVKQLVSSTAPSGANLSGASAVPGTPAASR